MADPMKIRATASGDTTEVKVLMNHEMETGQRKDAQGKTIPAWHITTVLALGLAALLVVLASGSGSARTEARIISITCAASGLVAFVGSRGRHLSWIVFWAIAALAWL